MTDVGATNEGADAKAADGFTRAIAELERKNAEQRATLEVRDPGSSARTALVVFVIVALVAFIVVSFWLYNVFYGSEGSRC